MGKKTSGVALTYAEQNLKLNNEKLLVLDGKLKKTTTEHEQLVIKCATFEKEAKESKEESQKAAEKARLNENEVKTKQQVKESTDKKDKAEVAEKVKEKQSKVVEKKEYLGEESDARKFPIVCPVESTRAKYSPGSPPINTVMIKVINELLTQAGATGKIDAAAAFAK